jgi:predicted nucleic acid-binding Zn ribbon protein
LINDKVSIKLKQKTKKILPIFDYTCEKCGDKFSSVKLKNGRKRNITRRVRKNK